MGEFTGINTYSKEQLSTIIEALFHQAVTKNCLIARQKLTNLHHQLMMSVDLFNTSVYWITIIVMAHLERHHTQVISQITFGSFPRESFEFLRFVYNESQKSLNPQTDSPKRKLPRYPTSIDPLHPSGIPETIEEYLKKQYHLKTKQKVGLNVTGTSEITGLAEEIVRDRFQYYRDLRTTRKLRSKDALEQKRERKPQMRRDIRIQKRSSDLGPFTYVHPYAQHIPRTLDMFPIHRIPLSEPLSIIIP